jgi:hypothetical protein
MNLAASVNPAKGESLTVSAGRDAEYRAGLRPAGKRAQKGPAAAGLAPQPPNQLAVVQVAQGLYKALTALLERGLVVVGLKAGGKALALVLFGVQF